MIEERILGKIGKEVQFNYPRTGKIYGTLKDRVICPNEAGDNKVYYELRA